jgi:hypothetical protein
MDRYRLRNEGKKDKITINIGIPMNLRHDQLKEVENNFGFCISPITLGSIIILKKGIDDTTKRFKAIKKEMDWNKSIPEQYFSYNFSCMIEF